MESISLYGVVAVKQGLEGLQSLFLQLGEDLFIPIKEREKTVEVGGVIL